jgi:hypothetical protein
VTQQASLEEAFTAMTRDAVEFRAPANDATANDAPANDATANEGARR